MSKQPANELMLLPESDPDNPIAVRLVAGEEFPDIARALSISMLELLARIEHNRSLRSAVTKFCADRVQAIAALKLRLARQALNTLGMVLVTTKDEKLKVRVSQLLLKAADDSAIQLALLDRVNDLEAKVSEKTNKVTNAESQLAIDHFN